MNLAAWHAIVAALDASDISTCVSAASQLHCEASAEDVPKLLALLKNDCFFIREAAAWPLAELVGPSVLPELFAAYQRGFDEGHDNDGFTTALIEIPALHAAEARTALERLVVAEDRTMRDHAQWLLTFCEVGSLGHPHGA